MTAQPSSFARSPTRFGGPMIARLARIDTVALERGLFILTVVLAADLVWIAPRPPLVDLPQHAAQVALWRDLLAGRSAWADLLRINLLTPYLIGYGAALPLSFVMPIEDAMRIVLTLAFLGFIGGAIALRRSFGGDPRLDWLFLFGFFGFAWHFGFFPFLAAAPIALAFLVVANGFAQRPTAGRGLVLTLVGVGLLLCHGLQFVLAVAVGGAIVLWRNRRGGWRRIAGVALPFAVLAGVTLMFRAASAEADGAVQFDEVMYGSDVWLKPFASLLYVTSLDLAGNAVPFGLTLLMLFAPRLRGAALNRGVAVLPFVALCAFMALLPSYAFQTAFLFHRFALFLLPFYALMFRPQQPRLAGDWGFVPFCLAAWLTLGIEAGRLRDFAAEAMPFETILRAAEPDKRALALVFDPASPAAENRYAYTHVPLWYQADKGGLVDFNFAGLRPMVVRFRPGAVPDYDPSFSRASDLHGLGAAAERGYDYIIVRGSEADVRQVLAQTGCRFGVRTTDAAWTLLARQPCPGRLDLKGSMPSE